MSDVPSNLIPTRITGLPEYLGTSTLGYLPYVIEGNTYKVQFANIAAVGAVPSTRQINTGTGLGGGGDLSANRTLFILPGGVDDSRLTTTGVTAGTYGSAENVPVFTVNAQGRVTGVTETPIVLTNYVPTSRTITAGAGLTGGGNLSANRTFAVNFSSTTPEPLGPGSAGVSTVAAREDHVHPAVDLSDTTETQGVLPLSRGGTGNSLSPVVGAIAYSSNDALYLTPTAGDVGQVLVSAGGLAPPFWQTITGAGTVTSINASGGTTGLTFTGGPITTSGTLTLGGTLAVANGGTGASTAGAARTNLGAAASGANTDITSIALTTGTISASPVSGTDIVNKLYADSIASGINFHQSVRLATAAALPANTYNNGTSGVGATLTANANGALSVDGVAVVAGNRILVKNEVAQANNGVYTVTQVGSGAAPYILTRATDFDSSGSGVDQIDAGDFFLVTAGSTQANTSWVQQTPLPIVVGTTAIVFSQFAAPVLYSAGTGLTLAGTVFSITNTGVAASTYGSASSVPVIAFNAQGQATSVTNTSIAIAASQITSGVLPVANGGTGVTTSTGTGSVVLSNSPTLVTPTLGAASATSIANGLGTVGAPSYTFTGDTNTGIYSPAADTIAFVEGGVEAMRLDASGNVGIGTISPAYKLDVTGSGRFGDGSGVPVIFVNGGSGANNGGYLNFQKNGTNSFYVGHVSGVVGGASNDSVLYNGAGNGLQIYTNNAERMRILSDGNVGIGTSAPLTQLNVPSSILVTSDGGYYGGQAYFASGSWRNAVTGQGGYAVRNTAGAYTVWTGASASAAGTAFTDFAERMRIDSSGNVGIGTSSPASRLHVVNSTINAQLRLQDVTTDATNKYGVVGTGHYTNAQSPILAVGVGSLSASNTVYVGGGFGSLNAATAIQFFTAANNTTLTGTERMRIDSSGNVGIGTSSPSRRLTVSATGTDARINLVDTDTAYATATALAEFSGSDGRGAFVGINGGTLDLYTEAALSGVKVSTNGSERMRIDNSGNVGIGTSSPSYKLQVSSSAAPILAENSGGGQYMVDLKATTGNYNVRLGNAGDAFVVGVNNVERMRIDSSGNVGIGTSSPTEKLVLNSAGSVQVATKYINGNTTGVSVGAASDGSAFVYQAAALPFIVYTNAAERFRILATGGITSADLADAVGYKGLPQNSRTSAYTLVLADQGKHIYATSTAFAVTIPANSTTAFPIGAALTIVVEDAAKTVVPAAGVTLVLAGTGGATTGTRTMAIGSVATLLKVGTDRWYISGSGVT